MMRLPNRAHTSRPWRIHELAPDFRLEDVWALPWRGCADDFPRLIEAIVDQDPSRSRSRVVRALFALRWKIGRLLGWDGEDAGVGRRVPSLRDRLPAELWDARGPEFEALPFTTLYLTADEFAAEIANRTIHGVMHIGRVPDPGGDRAQMAVLVKPNGLLGNAYMEAIKPFRHRIVYPAMLRARPVREIAVPPAARALTTLPRVDYEEAFLLDFRGARERPPDEVARAILEGSPPALRRALWLGWSALGLRLSSTRSPRSVLGWELRRVDSGFALLAAQSRIGMPAELLVKHEGDGLLFATFVGLENPLARALWAVTLPRHRPVVRHVLEEACRRSDEGRR